MKKFYLLLLMYVPLFIQAQQVIPNLFKDYNNYESLYYIDTSMYQNGECRTEYYGFDYDGIFRKILTYTYTAADNRFSMSNVLSESGSFIDYFRKTFFYENNRPSKRIEIMKIGLDEFERNYMIDSFVYENSQLKFIHRNNVYLNSKYGIENIYDSNFGLKGERISYRDNPSQTIVFFEVKEFQAFNLPKVLYIYKDSADIISTYKKIHFQYDSLNRIISRFDSTNQERKIIPFENSRVVYRKNSNQIDSIITYNFKDESISNKLFVYNNKNKVSYINTYLINTTGTRILYDSLEFLNLSNSILEELNQAFVLKLYPNPTSDKIFIDNNENIKQIEVFDLNGKRVLFKEENRIEQIDLSELTTGVYLLKAKSDLGTAQAKIVKTN